jgi:hypothetical protein
MKNGCDFTASAFNLANNMIENDNMIDNDTIIKGKTVNRKFASIHWFFPTRLLPTH